MRKSIEFQYGLNQAYRNLIKNYKAELMFLGVSIPKNENTLKRWLNKNLKNIELNHYKEYFKEEQKKEGKEK